jgi:glucose-1-phosphate thymidylyltransferase
MVISTPEDIGRYIQLLEEEFDAQFSYRVQKEPEGIAHALSLAKDFVDTTVAVFLGDNIVIENLEKEFETFEDGDAKAKIFLSEVSEPSRYGIAEVADDEIVSLNEKPNEPQSNNAVIGLYLYTADVFEMIPQLERSDRGEYEITDVNKQYLSEDNLDYAILDTEWFDVGTPEGMHKASQYVRETKRE